MFLNKERIQLDTFIFKNLYVSSPDNLNYQTLLDSEKGMTFLKNCFIEEWKKSLNAGIYPHWRYCTIEFVTDLNSMHRSNAENMNFYTIDGITYLIGFSHSKWSSSSQTLRVLPLP